MTDRTPPDLTHLTIDVRTSDSGVRSLAVSFLVTVQQTLLEDFDAMAHDAVLLHAHAKGHMPVGPILIMTETWTPPEPAPLQEGVAIVAHRNFDEFALEMQGRAGNIVQVTGECELGLSLD